MRNITTTALIVLLTLCTATTAYCQDEHKPAPSAHDDHGNTIIVTGRVIDEEGENLPGVTVKARGSKTGAISYGDGNFAIRVKKGQPTTLEFSFIGMKTITYKVKGTRDVKGIEIKMRNDYETVGDVVVTGYQTIDKRKLTSAISSITEKDLTMKGALTVDQMLEGKIPGLMTMTTSSTPGASTKMRLRGTSTFTGTREPLWVIDGIVYENPVPLSADDINSWDNVNLIGNAITGLNPQDIARIDVLKDASATAIYGTRAANGVIVVTTKTGQAGKTNINYSFNAQFQRRPHYSDFNLMTSKERIDVSREIMERGLYYQSTPERYGYEGAVMDYWDKNITYAQFQDQVSQMESNNTDWFGELYRNAFTQTHSVSVSGGNRGTRYYFSVGFNDDDSAEKGSDLKRITARSNLSTRLRDNIMLDVRLSGSMQDADYNPNYYSAFDQAYYTSRTIAARNSDGSYAYMQRQINEDMTTGKKIYGKYNILNEFDNGDYNVKNKSINLTASLNWEILPDLRYTTTAGLTTTTNLTESWMGEKSYYCATLRGYDYDTDPPRTDYYTNSLLRDGGIWSNSSTNQYSYVWRNQLNYSFDIAKVNHFNIDLGHEMSSTKYRGQMSGTIPGYAPEQGESFIPIWAGTKQDAEDYYWYLRNWFMGSGDVKATAFPTITDMTDNKLSFFLTSTYTYHNYFSLNFNIRNDGSNRFGQYENEKFNPVWSFSGRLNLNEFNWLPECFDQLALRASYGYRGSVPNATPYLVITTPKKNSVTGELGSTISSYPNANLKWEKTSTINTGLEYSMFHGRFTGGVDFYHSISTDLISMRTASLVNGTTSLYYNDGSATNTGLEVSLSTVNISTKDFKWRTSLTWSWNRNRIKSGSVTDNTYSNYLSGSVVRDGKSVDGFYSYSFAGLDSYGLPRYNNLTGLPSGLSTSEVLDMVLVYSGTRTPNYYGSFSTEFRWKDLSLRAEFSYKLGYHQRLLKLYQDGNPALPQPEDNMSSVFVDRWRKAGDEANTNIPALSNVSLDALPSYITLTGENDYLYTNIDQEYYSVLGPTTYTGWFMYDYSDARVVNASHIRLRTLTVGYDVPKSFCDLFHIGGVRIDFQAQNLAVWCFDKKLKGQDPDQVSSVGMPVLPSYNISLSVNL